MEDQAILPGPPAANDPPPDELGAEVARLLGRCLSLGSLAGLLAGVGVLAAGPWPRSFPALVTFLLLWALLGIAGGLAAAGLRLLAVP
jgi:hypothetical protein